MNAPAAGHWPEPVMDGEGRASFHEAGHAVMAMAFGFPVHAVSITESSATNGSAWIAIPLNPTKAEHVKLALVAASGFAAEAHFCHLGGLANAGFVGQFGDQRRAESHLAELGHEGMFLAYVGWARKFLTSPTVWKPLTELVAKLPKEGVLDDPSSLAAIARQVPAYEDAELLELQELFTYGKRHGLLGGPDQLV